MLDSEYLEQFDQLCAKVKEENDPDKLVELAKEVVRIVDECQARMRRKALR